MTMWTPDVTVAAVCEHEGRFLLVEERAKSSGEIVFNQPAGHLEPGESLIDAVVRETLEETCRHFTPSSLIGLYRLEAANGKTYIRYTFSGTVSEVDPAYKLDPDIIRTHWMSVDQLRHHTQLRSQLVLGCVNDYLAGHHYPLDILKEL